jgi:hypothetical protein
VFTADPKNLPATTFVKGQAPPKAITTSELSHLCRQLAPNQRATRVAIPGLRNRWVYRKETPMRNLFLGMMDRMGVRMDHFGDSTGKIDGLDLT